MKTIQTDKAPKAVGPYSQGVMRNDTLYVSGQLPFDPETNDFVSGWVRAQTTQSLNNILAVVNAAGLHKEDIVKCGIYLKNIAHFDEMNEAYEAFFEDHKPARFAVEVARLPKEVLVEIDAIAVKEKTE